MKKSPKISEAEGEVMTVLWEKASATANTVVRSLKEKTSWNHRTIRTLINRLVRKKALGFEKEGRHYKYYPLISEEEWVKAESRSFFKRIQGGSVAPMVAAFLQEHPLSQEEIKELKTILDKKGRERGKHCG